MKQQYSTAKWIVGLVLTAIVAGVIYSVFFKPNYGGNNNSLIFVVGALLLGALIMFLINKAFFSKPAPPVTIKESSHTVVESMRKVFKIVTAEGHFNEIYNFEESKNVFGFIPANKKALVVVHAKALIGYDFEKCVWEADELTQKVRLKTFPSPEVLSIDTDYKYYNMEENILNKFSKEDIAKIQENGKKQVLAAAKNSNLPTVAAEQMRTLLTEIILAKNWSLENSHLITDKQHSQIAGPENFVVNERV